MKCLFVLCGHMSLDLEETLLYSKVTVGNGYALLGKAGRPLSPDLIFIRVSKLTGIFQKIPRILGSP